MEFDNVRKKHTCNRGCGVGVAEGNEVRVLGEAVDDGEDNRLALNLRKALNEIQRDIAPNKRRYRQRLEQTRRVEVFPLATLTSRALSDELANGTPHPRPKEFPRNAKKGFLGPFVRNVVKTCDNNWN